ncbi:hypothetical protein ACV2YB_24905, partial [Enterobacter hormaechei]
MAEELENVGDAPEHPSAPMTRRARARAVATPPSPAAVTRPAPSAAPRSSWARSTRPGAHPVRSVVILSMVA